MKKITTLLVLVLSSFMLNAQDFRGVATYVSKTSTEDMMPKGEATQQIPDEMMKMIEEQMKKMSEKTFTLSFDRETSLYEEEIVLEAGRDNPMAQGFRMMSNTMYGDRKSTRLNSSHVRTSYAVFCLKKKNNTYSRPRGRYGIDRLPERLR